MTFPTSLAATACWYTLLPHRDAIDATTAHAFTPQIRGDGALARFLPAVFCLNFLLLIVDVSPTFANNISRRRDMLYCPSIGYVTNTLLTAVTAPPADTPAP